MTNRKWWRVAVAALVFSLAFATLVWAFAEEPLHFRDPYTGETGDQWEEISTLHDDLTYALALAAGFSISDSITLQVWSQLVDSEQIGPGDAISYTNCTGGAFYPTPDPADPQVCGQSYSLVAWPRWDDMQDRDHCVTSRFGPYSPFFHFPHQNAQEIGALHDWGWGTADRLVAYEAYAWGGPTVFSSQCRYTRTAVITTAMQAGSLEAFATYIHSLGDSYSHRECIKAMDKLGLPWGTHTLAGVPACNYNPANPGPDDVHGREFYTYTDALRTDEAVQAMYGELVARSVQREGAYFPISLDTPISGTMTLSDTLYLFVHGWDFDHPAERRALADQISAAAISKRRPNRRIFVPVVLK